jgi:hypothetical protein
VIATAANVHDLDETPKLVRDDDLVVYADAGCQDVDKRARDYRRRASVEARVVGRGPERAC